MTGLPPHITAATGIDALTHAIEAFVGNWATPYSDGMALSAVGLIFENLRTAYTDGTEPGSPRKNVAGLHLRWLCVHTRQRGLCARHCPPVWRAVPHAARAGQCHHAAPGAEVLQPGHHRTPGLAGVRARVGTEGEDSEVLAQKFLDAVDQLNPIWAFPPYPGSPEGGRHSRAGPGACHEAHTGYPVPRYMTQEVVKP
jgi:alcohol dehydrogenase